jgi:N6-L-threonylcarbamoyladenine synthase
MQAHILAHFLEDEKGKKETPRFPFICLTVSGGHTQLVLVKDHFEFEVLGQTIDDAVGEAFDKAAKILGLPYPGGPFIDKYAKEGDRTRFSFANSRVPNLDFSFSGIKTAVLYHTQKNVISDADKPLIAHAFQRSVVASLVEKSIEACHQYKVKTLLMGGGVAANSLLRSTLKEKAEANGVRFFCPPLALCLDNGAMIAGLGYRVKKGARG